MYRGSSRVTILALRSTCGSSLYPFHRSAWKWNSANFVITEFSDVRHSLGPHPLLAFLTQIGSLRVQKGAACVEPKVVGTYVGVEALSGRGGEMTMNTRNTTRTNSLLGYPADARLLFVNADDFGMCHAVNEAIIRSLEEGIVGSCSVMIPCPWALHALAWLQEAPDVSFGVHLTSVSEQPAYRWGPITCRTEVPSLIDEAGYFYPESRIEEFLEQVDVGELEREYRAQIEHVLDVGLRPTHLDSHCAIHTRREEIFEMTLGLARQYGLPLRAYYRPFIEKMRRRGYPTNDHDLMDTYDLDTVGRAARYARMLRALPVGLSEWALHPGVGNAELRAAVPSWRVRQSDFDFVVSQEARAILHEEGIILVDYRALKALWNDKPHA
jgi:chitin disaccharide deacetylase